MKPGMKYTSILVCIGSMPCGGMIFCCTNIIAPRMRGSTKYGSVAERSWYQSMKGV